MIKVRGNINFHAKFMSWSIRKRGTVQRIQMKTKIIATSLAKKQNNDGMI